MADRAHSTQRNVGGEAGEAIDRLGAKAAEMADRVAGAGSLGEAASEIRGAAGDLRHAAVEHGRALYESAKEQATGFADQRKNETAQSVSDLASSLRDSGKTFGDRPNIQAFMGSAADGLEQLADGIRSRSFSELYAEVEDYARRSPMTVGAVALAAGFLLARFIKSTSEGMSDDAADRRYRSRLARAASRSPDALDA